MARAVAKHDDGMDPRFRRSRAMLHDSLAKLLKEKPFESISIGEVTARAGLNRATFYDHYPDKQSLLLCTVATRLQELIAQRGISFHGCDTALENTVTAVLYFLEDMAGTSPDTPLERAVVQVVERLLLDGFAQHPLRAGVVHELAASVIAWAMYGGAREWLSSEPREAVPKAAARIAALIQPMFASIA